MIVEATVLEHPKFLLLRREVGDCALEFLVRLWGHCQKEQRGEDWGKVGADYVEAIAQWNGEAGKLYRSLLRPVKNGGVGWIEERRGKVIVHDWNLVNAKLVANWVNGAKGGRPKGGKQRVKRWLKNSKNRKTRGFNVCSSSVGVGNPVAIPSGTSGAPDKIGLDRRGEERSGECGTPRPLVASQCPDSESDSKNQARPGPKGEASGGLRAEPLTIPNVDAQIPTVEEMKAGLSGAGVLDSVIEKYHAYHCERQSWVIKNGRGQEVLRDWKAGCRQWQVDDRKARPGPNFKNNKNGAARHGVDTNGAGLAEEERNQLRCDLQQLEGKTDEGSVRRQREILKKLHG